MGMAAWSHQKNISWQRKAGMGWLSEGPSRPVARECASGLVSFPSSTALHGPHLGSGPLRPHVSLDGRYRQICSGSATASPGPLSEGCLFPLAREAVVYLAVRSKSGTMALRVPWMEEGARGELAPRALPNLAPV